MLILGMHVELFYRGKVIPSKLQTRIQSLKYEMFTLHNGFELLNEETTKLRKGYDYESVLHNEKTVLDSDIESLNKEKTKLRADIESLNKEKKKLGADTEFLYKEKLKLQSDFVSLNKQKSAVESDICLLNGKKTILDSEIESLDNVKTELGTETEFLNKEKTAVQGDIFSLNGKKTILEREIESLGNVKGMLKTDFEVTNKAKDKLQNDVELLNKEKEKLQSDIEFLNEEKAEFIRSVTSDVNESFYEREKALTENENVVARERVYSQELREAQQELIKRMPSEKVTANTVIGVKKRKSGDPELWNFREKRRATLKEVISFQLNRTNT
ncbi:hypothetical protein MKW94_003235 [Papaver nudicaule]|uniref:Uncharacterized protein n=1 Tax=Papaver nudicaule TaxID=74823 RepID=A0AA41SLN5_PAPNU|nr:hypothetical protein [Papaver nudicaule]